MTSVQSPQLQSRIAELRAKALDGSLTLEECRESVKFLRQDRYAALAAQPKKSKAKAPAKSAEELLKELGL